MKFIVLYGMSGSGKTTIAKEVSSVLTSKRISNSILSLDFFYKESYEGSFDEPDAFHWERLKFVIKQLLKKKTVYLQEYNYETKLYDSNRSFPIYPSTVYIIEGILANYCHFLHSQQTFTIKIDTPPDVCLARRILRDKEERNITPETNIQRWLQDVRVMWNQWQENCVALRDTLRPHLEISGDSTNTLERQAIYETLCESIY